ncbi:hypothetical protein Tco_1493809 [Tanacetum coccineum]
MSLSNSKSDMDWKKRHLYKAFKDSNRYELVRTKVSGWQSLSERRSQSNSEKDPTEANTFLALTDDPTLPEVDEAYYDPEGDILLLESLLYSDPLPSLNQGITYQNQEELKSL